MANELDSLVSEFARLHGLGAPRRDEKGRYFFLFDSELEVALFQKGDRILLEGRLGPVPERREEAADLLGQALRRHLGRLRDRTEVLTLDPEDGSLVLFRQLSARTLSSGGFEDAIKDFANALDYWQQTPSEAPRPVAHQMLFP